MTASSDSEQKPALLPFASSTLRAMQKYSPEGSLLLTASFQGEVLEACGSGDRDGLAAVAAITSRSFSQAVDKLGFGRMNGWVISGETSCCLAEVHDQETTVGYSAEQPVDSLEMQHFLSRVGEDSGDKDEDQ
ncbi:MAG: hypothetical protein KTR25_04615 [Myxococcales bacterium]|nr:hypothetical protein [Myxococcales bacterium]